MLMFWCSYLLLFLCLCSCLCLCLCAGENPSLKSEPELSNGGNVNTVFFSLSGEIFESVAKSFFTITKHTIANVCFYFQLRIMYVKMHTFIFSKTSVVDEKC